MTYYENIWIFSALLLGGILLPGPDMIFVLGNSLTKGRKAGLAATLGLVVGGLIHSAYAGLGTSLVVNVIPGLFTLLSFAGAAYLAWIGITLVRSSIIVQGAAHTNAHGIRDAFWRGIITCLLNPKAYLFMFAVYPQFLKPELGPIFPQAVVMAAILAFLQTVVYGGVAIATSRAQHLTENSAITIWLGRACGLLLICISGFTIWAAFARL